MLTLLATIATPDNRVPPVPQAPHAALIQHLSVLLVLLGIAVVLVAFSPVRRAMVNLRDSVADRLVPPRRVVTITTVAPDEELSAPPTRREIEHFDLDIFDESR